MNPLESRRRRARPDRVEFDLPRLLRSRAERDPDRVCYRWLVDGGQVGEHMTYADLDRAASAIAARLADEDVRGCPVILHYPPGLAFVRAFFGCLYARAIAVPVCPASSRRDVARLTSIAWDSGASLVLTTTMDAPTIERRHEISPGTPPLRCVNTTADLPQADARLGRSRPASTAYLQYTSGSTGAPKGVMISHANVLENLRAIEASGGFGADTVSLSWLPHFHDMGLVWGLLQPIFSDHPAYLASPAAFVQQPLLWLGGITRYQVTHSGGPNFAYDLCVHRARPEALARLDLRTWRVAFNGSEPIRPETLAAFARTFAPCGFTASAFYPVYGLAEATLKVTSAQPGVGAATLDLPPPNPRTVVNCGRTFASTRIAIVDPQSGERQADGLEGEIWIAGPGVAKGYWRKPEDTRRVFGARLRGSRLQFLRSGDLGLLRDGSLFVTGRLKDCIIIRGQNYYPQDIERSLDRVRDHVRPWACAAIPLTGAEGETLGIVCELQRHHGDDGRVMRAIRRAVWDDHGLEAEVVVLLRPGKLPKTSSGKVRRAETRARLLDGTLAAASASRWSSGLAISDAASAVLAASDRDARSSALERYVREEIGRVWHIDATQVDLDTPWTAQAPDSLASVHLVHRIERDLRVRAPETSFTSTMREFLTQLAARLDAQSVAPLGEQRAAGLDGGSEAARATAASVTAEPRIESDAPWPLSTGQQALWIHEQRSPGGDALTLARALRLRGGFDAGAARQAFEALAARHPALRTRLCLNERGEVVQRVTSSISPPIAIVDASTWSTARLDAALAQAARQPFSLIGGLLWRTYLFRRDGEHVWLLAVHHLIADLWSMTVLLADFVSAYSAACRGRVPVLVAPDADYRTFVAREAEWLRSPAADADRDYWTGQLHDFSPTHPLYVGGSQPDANGPRGGRHLFALPKETRPRVADLARATGVRPLAVLLAAVAAVLHRYSGDPHLAVAVPTHGRPGPEFARVLGYFTNPVLLRMQVRGDMPFHALLRDVGARLEEALRHARTPFAAVHEHLAAATGRRLPAFDVLFTLHSADVTDVGSVNALALAAPGAAFEADGLRGTLMPLPANAAQFDLTITASYDASGIHGALEYDAARFDDARMERFASHYARLLEAAVTTPEASVHSLPLLSEDERSRERSQQTAIDRGDGEPGDVPRGEGDLDRGDVWCGLAALLDDAAARHRDRIAIEFEGASLTYGQLHDEADALADRLIDRGVGPEIVVGVMAHRSLELVIANVAIVKAGGAFLPLEPGLPHDRLTFMVERAGAALIVAPAALLDDAARLGRPVLRLNPADTTTAASVRVGASADVTRAGARDSASRARVRRVVHPDTLAYVVFTSGSTGQPKGAANTQAGLANRLTWMQDRYRIGPDHAVLQKTPCSFDVSIWEFFWPLMTGARLIVASPGGHRDPAYLAQTIRTRRVTHVHFVPSMLGPFVAEPAAARCAGVLDAVICSGEALTPELRDRALRVLGARLDNLYGPTEAAIDVTAWTCAADDRDPIVPIGLPIADVRAHVLDARLDLAPWGQPGYLYLGGIGLARGYVGDPALTASRFVPDPNGQTPGARLYATGDRARRRADGALEYLGREDAQVKIRGVRVELGEIESVLARHPSVHACAVLFDETPDDPRLIAYVAASDDGWTEAAMRERVRERLPEAMVPARVVRLDALPRLSSGKIDRHALRRVTVADDERPVTPPRTAVEERLVTMWRDILQQTAVGVHDDFFALGGHSLSALRLLAAIRAEFDIDLRLQALFDRPPTIATVARLIEDAVLDQADPTELAHVMADLDRGAFDRPERPSAAVARDNRP
jgi:amino acid adenylation domain-containing protein